MSEVAPTIFVSHAADDREVVTRVVTTLQAAFPRANIFFSSASNSLQPGVVWWDEIRSVLERATVVLACVSRWSASRPWIYFEAGAALGHGCVLIPVIVDDLPISELGAPLSLFQVAQFDEEGVPSLLHRIAEKINHPPQVILHSSLRCPNEPEPLDNSPGVYVGRSRLDLHSGWVRYAGDSRALSIRRDHIAIGSFNDGFRYPPSDSLSAPWRIFGARFRFNDAAYLYPVLRLCDGTSRKIIATTAISAWGFTGDPHDEYRMPLGQLRPDKWHVVLLDLASVQVDFPSAIQSITGFRIRGPLSVSHLWCVDSQNDIPALFRKSALHIRYPR